MHRHIQYTKSSPPPGQGTFILCHLHSFCVISTFQFLGFGSFFFPFQCKALCWYGWGSLSHWKAFCCSVARCLADMSLCLAELMMLLILTRSLGTIPANSLVASVIQRHITWIDARLICLSASLFMSDTHSGVLGPSSHCQCYLANSRGDN